MDDFKGLHHLNTLRSILLLLAASTSNQATKLTKHMDNNGQKSDGLMGLVGTHKSCERYGQIMRIMKVSQLCIAHAKSSFLAAPAFDFAAAFEGQSNDFGWLILTSLHSQSRPWVQMASALPLPFSSIKIGMKKIQTTSVTTKQKKTREKTNNDTSLHQPLNHSGSISMYKTSSRI